MKFRTDVMPLGLDPGTIAAGTSILKTFLGPSRGQSPSGGPVFQQQFTPQFSPVMQQQQESPGGTQAASPTQYATGGPTAGPGIPGQPSITPYPSPLPLTDRSTVQTDSAQQYLKWGVIGLLGIAGIQAYKKRRK